MTPDKINWAFMPPNFNKEFFIAIINSKTKKMLATIMCH